jgi:hypothetical protein
VKEFSDRSQSERGSPDPESFRNWRLFVWILLLWYNLAFPFLATVLSVIFVLDLQKGGGYVFLLYPPEIPPLVANLTDGIGGFTAIVNSLLFVVLFRLLAQWRPKCPKWRRFFSTLLVFVPIWGLFYLRKIGNPAKLQFSLGALMGIVTASALVFSLVTTIIKISGVQGLVHGALVLELMLLLVGVPCFLLLLWRDRRRKKRISKNSPLSIRKRGRG